MKNRENSVLDHFLGFSQILRTLEHNKKNRSAKYRIIFSKPFVYVQKWLANASEHQCQLRACPNSDLSIASQRKIEEARFRLPNRVITVFRQIWRCWQDKFSICVDRFKLISPGSFVPNQNSPINPKLQANTLWAAQKVVVFRSRWWVWISNLHSSENSTSWIFANFAKFGDR